LERKLKKFHLQKLNWVVCFPNSGNFGKKYLDYTVMLQDKGNNLETQARLGDIVDDPKFEENIPHIVCFFKESAHEEQCSEHSYLEIRLIRSVEEFWKFLNDLDL
jgi:hypothetical protein